MLRSSTEDRLRALHQVLDEKLVKRQVSLKAFEDGKIEEAQKGTARQKVAIRAGISSDHAKRLNKFIKDLGLKGVSSQTQGDQLRVTGKKRDDLQEVIAEVQGGGLRDPAAVQQLPGLSRRGRGAERRRQRRRSVASACLLLLVREVLVVLVEVDVEELVEDEELERPTRWRRTSGWPGSPARVVSKWSRL